MDYQKAVTIPQLFHEGVENFGSKTLVSSKHEGKYREISWQEMGRTVRGLASFLIDQGIKKKDRIAIFSENRHEWWEADLASLSAGAIDVPIYSTNSPDEAAYIISDSECRICFAGTEAHLEKLKKVRKKLPSLELIIVFNDVKKSKGVISFAEAVRRGEESVDAIKLQKTMQKRIAALKETDVATIMYTSGTTGSPKGVMLTHSNIIWNVKQSLGEFGAMVRHDSTFISFLPLSHALERTVGFYLPVYAGSMVGFVENISTTLMSDFLLIRPTVLVSVPRIFEKIHSAILAKLDEASPVSRFVFNWAMKIGARNVPYNCKNLKRGGIFDFKYRLADRLIFSKLKAAIGFDRIDFAISGGGPLSVSDAEFFLGMGLKVFEGYGLTETTPVTNANRVVLNKPGSVGPALMETHVRISDDGEVQIKGPQIMKGYYKHPAETKGIMTADGYLKTGDVGILDEDGYLWITGRIKDIIVTAGGKNISPQNIEGQLLTSRYIEQCAVIGDRRKFLSVLIVPSFTELKKWAVKKGISATDKNGLVRHPQVHEMFENEIKSLLKNFSRVEQVKKFSLLSREWDQAGGELTPSLKVKRRIIEEKYRDVIESMYASE